MAMPYEIGLMGLLALNAGSADAFHDVLSEEDEKQEERDGDKDGRGHLIAIGSDASVDVDEGGRAKAVGDKAVFAL